MTWYAIQTMAQHEFKAEIAIRRLGYRAECPVAIEQRQRLIKGARVLQEVQRPMYPGYCFAEFGAAWVPNRLRLEGAIIGPVPSWSHAVQIPADQVEAALSLSGKIRYGAWLKAQRLAAGDRVRRKGDDSGLEMTIDEIRKCKAVLIFESLRKEHRVTVPIDQLEAI